jgi:hypothetical protein
MAIEASEQPCPDCGRALQIIYVTDQQQVIAGYACGECGYAASEKDGNQSVPLANDKEYVLRIEKPLTRADISEPFDDIEDEFRARARDGITEEEVWLLIDPEEDAVVDFVAGDSFPPADEGD